MRRRPHEDAIDGDDDDEVEGVVMTGSMNKVNRAERSVGRLAMAVAFISDEESNAFKGLMDAFLPSIVVYR